MHICCSEASLGAKQESSMALLSNCSQRGWGLRRAALMCATFLLACASEEVGVAQTAVAPAKLPDGTLIPEDEGAAMDIVGRWLDTQQWSEQWQHGNLRGEVYASLAVLAEMVQQQPSLAIGLGQNLYSYFWWDEHRPGGKQHAQDARPDFAAGRLAAEMHLWSIRVAQCDDAALPSELWTQRQCAWRWRYTLMIMVELGVALASLREDPRGALELFRDARSILQAMRNFQNFGQQRMVWKHASDINTNAAFFPGPVNRPIWPTADVPLAVFLEEHASVFAAELDKIVDSGRFEALYWSGEVSLTQFAPKLDDWMPVSIVKNRRRIERTCAETPRTCELLEQRSEIMRCSAKDAGATFARLNPGSALKPHFWNTPRLGVHLGLRTPPGAKMVVGGSSAAWRAGKAVVFDDTYVHSVQHTGDEPRFILVAWFCHPCDRELADVRPEREEPLCLQTA